MSRVPKNHVTVNADDHKDMFELDSHPHVDFLEWPTIGPVSLHSVLFLGNEFSLQVCCTTLSVCILPERLCSR